MARREGNDIFAWEECSKEAGRTFVSHMRRLRVWRIYLIYKACATSGEKDESKDFRLWESVDRPTNHEQVGGRATY